MSSTLFNSVLRPFRSRLLYHKEDSEYLPIRQQEKTEILDNTESLDSQSQSTDKFCKNSHPVDRKYSSWIPWVVILCLVLSNLYTWKRHSEYRTESIVFSPAQPIIRYENVVSTSGILDDISPYQGPPSKSNNELWRDLYDFGISKIPLSEAAQLANRTVPIAEEPGYYAVTLDVFHQLHCLNMIRQTLWSASEMTHDGAMGPIHLDHCIDSLRQTLMCAGDITPLPWVWYTHYEVAVPTTNVLRTCRDFDAIREWGREHQSFKYDYKVHADDPLGNIESDDF